MTTPKIEYRPNPRYLADTIPIYFGSSQDSRLVYDATNDEWTVQTKDSGGTQTDRVMIDANVDITRVELYNDDAGATGIRLDTFHESVSPAISDVLRHDRIFGMDGNATSAKQQFGGLKWTITNITDTTEAAQVDVELMVGGVAAQTVLSLNGALLDVKDGVLIELNELIRWDTTGAAITAAAYQVGRDDGDVMHLNVPTGSSFELSINDIAQMTISATDIRIGGTADGDVLLGDNSIILRVDGGVGKVRIGYGGGGTEVPQRMLDISAPGLTAGTHSQIILRSFRDPVSANNLLGGVEVFSDDTSNASPGLSSGYIRLLASESHITSQVGSYMVFGTTVTTAAAPADKMRLENTGALTLLVSADSAAIADQVSVGRYEIGAGNTVLALSQETAVAAEADETKFSHKLQARINGATYYIMMTQT